MFFELHFMLLISIQWTKKFYLFLFKVYTFYGYFRWSTELKAIAMQIFMILCNGLFYSLGVFLFIELLKSDIYIQYYELLYHFFSPPIVDDIFKRHHDKSPKNFFIDFLPLNEQEKKVNFEILINFLIKMKSKDRKYLFCL